VAVGPRRAEQGGTASKLGPRAIYVGVRQPRRSARGCDQGEPQRQPLDRADSRSTRRRFRCSAVLGANRTGVAPRFGGVVVLPFFPRYGRRLWAFTTGSHPRSEGRGRPLFEPPAPSPDGRRVAVVRKRDGKHRLTIMSANGRNHGRWPIHRRIRDGRLVAGQRRIVTGGKDAEGVAGLFMIPVDGDHAGEPSGLQTVWRSIRSRRRTAVSRVRRPVRQGQVSLFAVRPDRTPVELPSVRSARRLSLFAERNGPRVLATSLSRGLLAA